VPLRLGKIFSLLKTQKIPLLGWFNTDFFPPQPSLMPEYAEFEFVIISFPFVAGLALKRIKRALPYLVDFLLDTLPPFFYIRFIPMQDKIPTPSSWTQAAKATGGR